MQNISSNTLLLLKHANRPSHKHIFSKESYIIMEKETTGRQKGEISQHILLPALSSFLFCRSFTCRLVMIYQDPRVSIVSGTAATTKIQNSFEIVNSFSPESPKSNRFIPRRVCTCC